MMHDSTERTPCTKLVTLVGHSYTFTNLLLVNHHKARRANEAAPTSKKGLQYNDFVDILPQNSGITFFNFLRSLFATLQDFINFINRI